MSVADDIQDLADLCGAAAHKALDAIVGLGARPTDDAAGHAWDQARSHLQDQMDNLSAMAVRLSSQAVVEALAAEQPDLTQLSAATKKAQAEIKVIHDTSKLITRAAQVLDVGLAVLGLAGAPSIGAAQTLASKVLALASPLPGDN